MQTFLPYPDFKESAEALRDDWNRLGKQRVENLQLIQSITKTRGASGKMGLSRGHQFHPAARMWEMDGGKYALALLKYQEEIIRVWTSKGYKDTCWEKSRACFSAADLERYERGDYEMPPWFGDPALHQSHKDRLLAKAPEIYGPLFPDATPIDDYPFWPGPSLEEAKAAAGILPPAPKKRAKKASPNETTPASAFKRAQPTDADVEEDLIIEEVENLVDAREPIQMA